MLLAIEQGNTNTLFAVHDGADWVAQWRTATDSTRTADEYAVWLSQLLGLQGLALATLTGCVISTVVPQALFNLRNLSRRYLKVEPLIVSEFDIHSTTPWSTVLASALGRQSSSLRAREQSRSGTAKARSSQPGSTCCGQVRLETCSPPASGCLLPWSRQGRCASLRDGPSAHPCLDLAAAGIGWLRGAEKISLPYP